MTESKRRPGRPSIIDDAVEIRATIARSDRDRLLEIGAGNISMGVRIAARAYPISGKTTENPAPSNPTRPVSPRTRKGK